MSTRISAGISLLLLIMPLAACGPGRSQEIEEVPPELTFDKLTFRVYRGAVLTAQGEADRAWLRRDNSDVAAERLDVRFPGDASRPAARVLASYATGNLKARRFVASAVRAEQAGRVANTEEARYAADDGLVRGDHPIQVRGEGFTVHGPGFTLDPRDEILHIGGGATVVAGAGEAP